MNEEIKPQTKTLAQSLQDESQESAAIIRRVVTIGCCVNALLMCLKLFAGWFGHSEALFADGFHSLNDILSDIIMFVFVGISYRPADHRYSYGYGKFGTFSSFLMSAMLIVIAVFIAKEGIESIIAYAHGEELMQPDIWTFIVVLFAMATKEGLYHYYSKVGRKTDSKALIANAWHHRSDAMASIATLIGVTFAHFFGSAFRVLDPIASLVIAVFIFIPALKLIISSFSELMEHSLPPAEVEKAKNIIEGQKDVKGIQFIHTRRNGHDMVFDIGIKIDGTTTVQQASEISDNIKKNLCEAFCPHIRVSISTFPDKD